MSNIVPQSVKQAIMGSKGSQAKVDQLAADMVEPTKDTRITSDWGTKQTNTDDWLKVNNENHTGPMLLEDGFAREKVSSYDSPCPRHAFCK
jgi:catalase